MIKQGNTELFGIDPKTGVIKTVRGLDYERENQHILIIGTVENTSDSPGSTTRVVVNVQVSIVVTFLDSSASSYICTVKRDEKRINALRKKGGKGIKYKYRRLRLVNRCS